MDPATKRILEQRAAENVPMSGEDLQREIARLRNLKHQFPHLWTWDDESKLMRLERRAAGL